MADARSRIRQVVPVKSNLVCRDSQTDPLALVLVAGNQPGDYGYSQDKAARVAKLADAPDLGSGGAILRGSSPLPGTSRQGVRGSWEDLRLAAIFEEQHFCGPLRIVEADGAIAPHIIGEHAATRPPAVHLMDAEM